LPKLYFIFLTALLTLACGNKKQDGLPVSISGKVIAVIDGDTIDVLYEGKPLRIRFAHIDCPEIRKGQPFGRSAKQFISDRCFGLSVSVENHNNTFDRNRRLIAEVIAPGGINLNEELVKAGLAWHFKKYSHDKKYAALEESARKQGVGLWSEMQPTPPWEWREIKASNKKKS
jgi:micrococcal nuclease